MTAIPTKIFRSATNNKKVSVDFSQINECSSVSGNCNPKQNTDPNTKVTKLQSLKPGHYGSPHKKPVSYTKIPHGSIGTKILLDYLSNNILPTFSSLLSP